MELCGHPLERHPCRCGASCFRMICKERKRRGDASEGYSLRHNRISRGSRLDGVSACRTLWFTAVYDLLVVSQEYGVYHSVFGKNLHGFWYCAFSAIVGQRIVADEPVQFRPLEAATGSFVLYSSAVHRSHATVRIF